MQCRAHELKTWQVATLRTAGGDKHRWFLHLVVKGPGEKVYKMRGLSINLGQNSVSFGSVEEIKLAPDTIVEPVPATCCFAVPAEAAVA